MNRRRIRTPGDIEHVAHDLLVIPAARELRLAGVAGAGPVSAAAPRLAVQNVRHSVRANAESIKRRAVIGVKRVPAGTLRPRTLSTFIDPGRLLAGRAERLVVLRPASWFCRFRPRPGISSVRRAGAKMPFEPTFAGPVVMRSV
jgi:hypothetical protein